MKTNKQTSVNICHNYGQNIEDLLNKLRETYNNAVSNLPKGDVKGVSIEYKRDYGDSIDIVMEINMFREETRDEEQYRLRQEEQTRLFQRRQYEELKKKFKDG